MTYKGCIYTEYHNKGKHYKGTLFRRDPHSNPNYLSGCFRYVAEIHYHGKRYRCRSHIYERVFRWLQDMRNKFNEFPIIPKSPSTK